MMFLRVKIRESDVGRYLGVAVTLVKGLNIDACHNTTKIEAAI